MGVRVVGLAEETTWGTAQLNPDWHQETESGDANLNTEPVEDESGSRMTTVTRAGKIEPTANAEGKLDFKRIGHYLKAFLGNYVFTEGTGETNTHEFYGGENANVPSFTGWWTFDVIEKVLTGAILETFKFEIKEDFIKTSSEWKYKTHTINPIDPALFNKRTIAGDMPVMDYECHATFGEDAIPSIVYDISIELKNNFSDKVRGVGSRAPARKAGAQKREIKIEFTSILEDASKDLVLKAEHGADSSTPTCKILKLPFKLHFYFCDDDLGDDELVLYFPMATVIVEYDYSGADEIEPKFTLSALGTDKATLLSGNQITTDFYAKLINNQPKIEPHAIEPTGTVNLYVHDNAVTPADISGATVTLTSQTTQEVYLSTETDADGDCSITSVPYGSYDVSIVDSTSEELEITTGKTLSVNSAIENRTIIVQEAEE